MAVLKVRQLMDGEIAVNEIIDLARKTKSECLIFKVDFEKAYNSVRRSFLDYMMRRMGFGEDGLECMFSLGTSRCYSMGT